MSATTHPTMNVTTRAMGQPVESGLVSVVPMPLRADVRPQAIPLNMPQVHTLAFCVRNNPGVLQRIAGIFCRRAVALRELSFQEHSDGCARVYVSFMGSAALRRQVVGQLEKMLDAVPVHGGGPDDPGYGNQGDDGT